ncbi:MAG: hypothetical protein ACK4K0_09990 [Flavobacteriales bacterium]
MASLVMLAASCNKKEVLPSNSLEVINEKPTNNANYSEKASGAKYKFETWDCGSGGDGPCRQGGQCWVCENSVGYGCFDFGSNCFGTHVVETQSSGEAILTELLDAIAQDEQVEFWEGNNWFDVFPDVGLHTSVLRDLVTGDSKLVNHDGFIVVIPSDLNWSSTEQLVAGAIAAIPFRITEE